MRKRIIERSIAQKVVSLLRDRSAKKEITFFFAFKQKNQRNAMNPKQPATANWQRFFSSAPVCPCLVISPEFNGFHCCGEYFSWKVNVMENFLFTHEISLWIMCDSKVFSCPHRTINSFPPFMRTSFSWRMNLLKVICALFSSMWPYSGWNELYVYIKTIQLIKHSTKHLAVFVIEYTGISGLTIVIIALLMFINVPKMLSHLRCWRN